MVHMFCCSIATRIQHPCRAQTRLLKMIEDLVRSVTQRHKRVSSLTLECQEILTGVVWTIDIFENNFGITHKFTKYLKGSRVLNFDQRFSFKYFMKIAFVRDVSPNKVRRFWALKVIRAPTLHID